MSSFRATLAENIPTSVILKAPDSASEFVKGDLVYIDTTTDTIKQCGADPALIAAVAEVDATSSALHPAGLCPIRLLRPDTVVALSSATDYSAASDGNTVDIVDTSSGIWRVLPAATSNPRVLIRNGVTAANSLDGAIYFVQFIAANLQFDAIAS